MSFKNYTNPEMAKRVWADYKGELSSRGCLHEGQDILEKCTDATELDVKLDLLITNSNRGRGPEPKEWPEDPVAEGYWDNAVRIYERG
jgi:hypothetical protein